MPDKNFPIVGIGASAGGLEALKAFFASMPADCGMAFVVVTHPCFREERYSSFKTQFKNDSYLRDGIPFTVDVFDRDRAVQFVDYHELVDHAETIARG